ncbi:DOMON-like domain-containing protein [Sphingomonas sp.]|uniref:DOMON-like domain-containing protein n=1 Tax=Sphingomonas sp. TaxID=28214 RepID=UPI0025F1ADED|nr:DOMON-like domain-containing protein [Sphingomonas sp.]MBV9529439.1 DOMON-like domain-containing protein [Sphingomonas sp.]
MELTLVPHPSTPPTDPPFRVWARVEHSAAFGSAATTNIWFGVSAPLERFVIPRSDEPGRADDLWRTTCFEAFLQRSGDEAYREWNFAPSGSWAAYDFAAYRERLGNAPVAAVPYIRAEDNFTWWALGATISVDAVHWQLGLSAVIEEQDGTKSYWALAHAGEKPDFHDARCFTAKLA